MTVSILISFIHILTFVLVAAIIIRAIMSWIAPAEGAGLTAVLADVTEPILRPVRNVLPPIGGFDLSPIVALILIQLVSALLVSLLSSLLPA